MPGLETPWWFDDISLCGFINQRTGSSITVLDLEEWPVIWLNRFRALAQLEHEIYQAKKQRTGHQQAVKQWNQKVRGRG